MYRLETTPDFDKDLKAIERDVANRISKKLEWLSKNPESLRFPTPSQLWFLRKST